MGLKVIRGTGKFPWTTVKYVWPTKPKMKWFEGERRRGPDGRFVKVNGKT